MRVIDCPGCLGVAMQPFFVEGRDGGPRVELDRCPKCTRLWFDVKELERAAGQSFLPRLRGQAGAHACPVCRVTMGTSLIRGDVPIEECGTCGGAMLDAGDFELISGAPLKQVKPAPQPSKPAGKPLPKKPAAKATPRVVEFACARCHQLTPVAEAGNVNGATVCKRCALEPWPDQPTWYNTGNDPLSRFLEELFGSLFR
jgi:Zn-finger nucleic acid-binding protein